MSYLSGKSIYFVLFISLIEINFTITIYVFVLDYKFAYIDFGRAK